MTALLKIEDLKIYYDSVEALKGISLEVKEGEIVTVLGANGAGKSTLLRAISGLLPIRSGKIKLNDQELNNVKAFKIVMGGISHVPEGRKVFATLTVDENLNLGAYTRRKDKRRLKNPWKGYMIYFLYLKRGIINYPEHYQVENSRCWQWEEV